MDNNNDKDNGDENDDGSVILTKYKNYVLGENFKIFL